MNTLQHQTKSPREIIADIGVVDVGFIGGAIGAAAVLGIETFFVDGPISIDAQQTDIDHEASKLQNSVSLEDGPQVYYETHAEAAELRATKPEQWFPGAMPFELVGSIAIGATVATLLFKKYIQR